MSLNFYSMFKPVICGVLMGVANVIPGISGATIAVMMRQYSQIVSAMHGLISGRCQWRMVGYLLVIMLSALVGFYICSDWIQSVMRSHNGLFRVVISGMMVGSLPFIRWGGTIHFSESMDKPSIWSITTMKAVAWGGVGVLAALGLGALSVDGVSSVDHPVMVAISSGLAMAAMLVPGVSGAMILLIMGTYSTVLTGIQEVDLSVLWPSILGAILGGLVSIQGIHWLMTHARSGFYSVIMGLIIGSIGVIIWAQSVAMVSVTHFIGLFFVSAVGSFGWMMYAQKR